MRLQYLALPVVLIVGCGDDNESSDATDSAPVFAPTLVAEADLVTQTDSAYGLEWTADGGTVVVAAGAEFLLVRADQTVAATLVVASGAIGAAASPDGQRFATVGGLHNSTITVWDWDATAGLTLVEEIDAGADQFAVSWSPDGQLLASLAGDRVSTLQVWDTTTWGLNDEFELPYTNSRRALNWSADSSLIYDAGEIDGEAGYFSIDANDGTVSELGRLPLEQVVAFALSGDGSMIAVAGADGTVRVIDIASAAVLAEFQSVADPVDLAWNPVDGSLAVLSYNTALQLWSVS